MRSRKAYNDALTRDEVTIITGVLEMRHKKAADCMIRIANVFSFDIKQKIDKQTIEAIIQSSHSRVPLYRGEKKNIVGFVLVKNLLLINDWSTRSRTFEELQKENHDSFRFVKFVSQEISLLELLNLFQTGRAHLVVVLDGKRETAASGKTFFGHPSRFWADEAEGEVVGIVTLEDVIEELIQEEIIDETDKFVDVEKRDPVSESSLIVDPMLTKPFLDMNEEGETMGKKKKRRKKKRKCCHRARCCLGCCGCCPKGDDSDEESDIEFDDSDSDAKEGEEEGKEAPVLAGKNDKVERQLQMINRNRQISKILEAREMTRSASNKSLEARRPASFESEGVGGGGAGGVLGRRAISAKVSRERKIEREKAAVSPKASRGRKIEMEEEAEGTPSKRKRKQ